MKFNNQFWWLEIRSTDPLYSELMYDETQKKWVTYEELMGWGSSCVECHSYKAAKRHIRKHSEFPKGTKFLLVSKWKGGYDRCLAKK